VPPRARAAALLAALALLGAGCGGARDEGGDNVELRVFAAASLTAAFTELSPVFVRGHPGARVSFNFAGSQALATQLQQSAPADVFASADVTNMQKVAALVESPRPFAGNRLEIVVARGNPKGVRGLADLGRADLVVVLAGPEVPAGRYARQALAGQGVRVAPRSLEENVKAVVTKVALGSADAGIVYVTDVAAGGDRVDGVAIPSGQNVPAVYPIAVVKATRQPDLARAFVDLVRSEQGQQVLRGHGFLPPPTT
jgi:molybdate transport system substrate-binding protein